MVRSGDYYLFETDSEEEEEEDEKKDDEPPKKSAFQVRSFELYSIGMMLLNTYTTADKMFSSMKVSRFLV